MKKKRTENKFTILILGKLPPPYMGPSIATEIILNSSLKERFHLIHQDTKMNRKLSGLGKWRFSKIFRQVIIAVGIKWKIIRFRPQLVWIPISQTTGGFLKDSLYIMISRCMARKVLIHLRGSDFRNWLSRSPKWVTRYVHFVLRRSKGVIVLGECLRYLFAGFFPPERIFVVPNGADYMMPARSRGEDGFVRMAYLGNLQPTKGIEDVIRAMVLLKTKTQKAFELKVVGAWRDEDTKTLCEGLVKQHKLPVTFLSAKSGDDKLQFLADSDIFVFPPRAPEGHPWVIVEALAAGLPIVATDQGAIRESVIHGENGFIVESEKPEELAVMLEKLIQDEDLRKSIGKKSREWYEANFTMDRMVAQLKKVLDDVIGE